MPPFPFSYCCLGSGAHLLFHARQPAKAPGGHINYIAVPPLFSHVYLWVCLLSQTVPICSLSVPVSSYLVCTCVLLYSCSQIYFCIFYAQIHGVHTHSCSLSEAGHNGWWENPPQRALIATGSAVHLVQVCVCICVWLPVCLCALEGLYLAA